MIYKTKAGDIDLDKLTRLYPASVVDLNGETAEMSLEWTDLNADKVKVLRYVLVFDSTPPNQEQKIRTALSFDTKDELILEMQKVSEVLNG
ncbi:hypothetical protein FJR48_04555 [Sulfurimonas lithotrophica]|uniref:Phosphomannomutase n=1 Tax=Sulfurimonas lithotrophica TaxID=2590022 RepID=A0A5P8P023_9BACT|nr:hypothetical protein [Sulfurimonas lithotrophica]QFR49034.1 hypothetical protein FJR48_04555 [Sulfurimonas lithotrophica]